MRCMRSFDILGNVAVVKFPREMKQSAKKIFAKKLMEENKSVTTVLEKIGKFRGRLRTHETKWVAGEKTKEVLYRENGCVFRFNIDATYFSPRLSNERKEIADKIKKGEEVFVMFAGVAPFPIVIAKKSKATRIFSNDISLEANKYAELNITLNKLKDRIELVPGDIKKVVPKIRRKFDVVVVAPLNLEMNFLEQAFKLSKKRTRIYYYDFCKADEINYVVEKVKKEARRAKKKIRILKTKRAGEIAPYRIRARIDFIVE